MVRKVFIFFTLLFLFEYSSAQVVSGRVGVFRDSIYVNGKWYSNLNSGGGGISGSGTAGYVPVFTSNNEIGNSPMYFDDNNYLRVPNLSVGNDMLVATPFGLTVNGNFFFSSINGGGFEGNVEFRHGISVLTDPLVVTSQIGVGTNTPDSSLQIVGGLHATNGLIDNNLNVTKNVNAYNFNTASGSLYVRTSGFVSMTGSSSGINSGADAIIPNVFVRMDTLLYNNSYNMAYPNGVNMLIINNQNPIPDTVYIPNSSTLSTLDFSGGVRPSVPQWNGAARVVYLVNLTPATGQPVLVYPQPGETLNGGTEPYTLPANSISMVVGLNGANVIK